MALIKPVETVIEQRRKVSSLTQLRYPSDLGAHAMIFNFKDYSYRGGDSLNTVNTSRTQSTITSSIALPLPSNINDAYNITVGSKELGIFGAGAADALTSGFDMSAIQSVLNDVFAAGTDTASKAGGGNFTGALSNVAKATAFLARAGLTSLPGGAEVAAGVSSATGTTVNPHVGIVFDGIGLKTHNFDWTFAPKNSSESSTVRDIISTFRTQALPSYATPLGGNGTTGTSYDRAIFKYPSMVDIFFVGLDQEYFFYFKTCMINTIDVDYAPQGQHALIKGDNGARPALIHFKVSLTEAEIHTKEDYGGQSTQLGINGETPTSGRI